MLFAIATECFSQSSRPIVTNISAKYESKNVIKVSWTLPDDFSAESILIFRSELPFSSESQIKKTSPVAKVSSTATFYKDAVPTYKEYYYAVIAQDSKETLYSVIIPSVNSTVFGAKVARKEVPLDLSEEQKEMLKEKTYENGQLREVPLPYIGIIDDFDRKPTELSKAVKDAGKDLAEGITPPKKTPLTPYFFEEDLVSPAGGDDYFLFEILLNYFVKSDYEKAVSELQNFLSINRSEETTNRAAFYLGEAQYYLRNYRHALSMFLFVADEYPVLSRRWIESTLNFFVLPADLEKSN